MARLNRRQKEEIVQQTLHRISPAAAGSAPGPVTGVASVNGRTGNVVIVLADVPVHHATHENGGSDQISVAGLLGVLTNPQPPIIGSTATTAVAGNDSRLTDARTPLAHAATHQPGASDAMAVDAVAATGSLRTLGAGAQQAAAGTDSRFLKATISTAEVNLVAAPNARRNGHVQITGLSGLTIGKPVIVTQAPGPYTGKGTRADEAEMDTVDFIGNILSATVIDLYWQAVHMVRGNFKVNYLVGA